MDSWVLVLGIVGACLIGFIIKKLYFDPAEREYKAWVRTGMLEQAQKRQGTVKGTNRNPMLIVPHKTVNIELSFVENNEELYNEYTYAIFKTDVFADKDFKIILDSKELLLKPLVIGTRLETPDEKFNEKYIVVGSDARFVNDILTPEIREKLSGASLQAKFGRRVDSSTLSRERGWLSIFTRGLASGDEVFDALIETAILFYERLEALNTRGQLRPDSASPYI